jgi:hypothetical protein
MEADIFSPGLIPPFSYETTHFSSTPEQSETEKPEKTTSYAKEKFKNLATRVNSGLTTLRLNKQKKKQRPLSDCHPLPRAQREENPILALQALINSLEKSHESFTELLEQILQLHTDSREIENTQGVKLKLTSLRKKKGAFQTLCSEYMSTESKLIQIKQIECISSFKLNEVSQDWEEESVTLVEKEEYPKGNERLLKLKTFYLESIPKMISLVEDILPRIKAQLRIISYAKLKSRLLVEMNKRLMELLEKARWNLAEDAEHSVYKDCKVIIRSLGDTKNQIERSSKQLSDLIDDLVNIIKTHPDFKTDNEEQEKEEKNRNELEIPAVNFCDIVAKQSGEVQLLRAELEENINRIEATVFQIEAFFDPLTKGSEIKKEVQAIVVGIKKILDTHFNQSFSPQDPDWQSTLLELQKRYSQIKIRKETYTTLLAKKLEKIRIQVVLSPSSQPEAKKAYEKQHDILLKRLFKLNCRLAIAPFEMDYLKKTITAFDASKVLYLTLLGLAREAQLFRVVRAPKEKSNTCPGTPDDESVKEKLRELIKDYEVVTGLQPPIPTIWHRLKDEKCKNSADSPILSEINLDDFYDKPLAKKMAKKLQKTLKAIQAIQKDQPARFSEFRKMIDEADRNACEEINLLARGVQEGRYRPEGVFAWLTTSFQQDVIVVTPLAKRRINDSNT